MCARACAPVATLCSPRDTADRARSITLAAQQSARKRPRFTSGVRSADVRLLGAQRQRLVAHLGTGAALLASSLIGQHSEDAARAQLSDWRLRCAAGGAASERASTQFNLIYSQKRGAEPGVAKQMAEREK